MAQGNYRGYLQSDAVRTKKYFYVLRPLLGCRWIERDIGAVPMEFERLVHGTEVPDAVRSGIATLLEKKRVEGEIGQGPRNEVLSEFIESEFRHYEEEGLKDKNPRPMFSNSTRSFRKR